MKKNSRLQNWIAPGEKLLPDFIIGGAMKCGTTTLHQILDKHPQIFIPTDEIGFFDIDNHLQHSDYSFYHKGKNKWTAQIMNENPSKMWDWYLKKFAGKEKFLKGEDSTTYLASKIAAERIAIQKKEIKLIFLLRQPTMRAYSNYYHMLRRGKVIYSFEDTIKYSPYCILNRSLYKEQLEHYYEVIPKERIKVVLFEELIANTESVIREICDFIQVDFKKIPADVLKTHANRAKLPIILFLQLKKNYLLRNFGSTYYAHSLPNIPPEFSGSTPIKRKLVNLIHFAMSPLVKKRPPEINETTKAFLDEYFYKELDGIDELVNKDILSKWFKAG
ncbi:sulfotransferase [candidate division KSB1 bacterium]|nr:sulfotransferase [candidate division KSB1 bacterium]